MDSNNGIKKAIAVIIPILLLIVVCVTFVISSKKEKKTNEEDINNIEDIANINSGEITDTSLNEISQLENEGKESENPSGLEENEDNNIDNISENDVEMTRKQNSFAKKNTGKLSEKSKEYTGEKGSGDYNYAEALQKSLLFYELQRSGYLPEKTRCNWRGDSSINDGLDVGLDLTGGWYDAGDNVKFNLPMAYTASVLGWSLYENQGAYEECGQVGYALANIKWANDYFIKCHPEDEVYYYQVGDGGQDHSFWGAAEVVEYKMDRPSYAVTKDNPGSTVCAQTAASLAICSLVYKNINPEYSDLCLSHAQSLFKFAEDTKSDAGYVKAAGFYDSWSGFYDELSWSGAWLYLATNDEIYLEKAKEYYGEASQDYKWAFCWDDVHIGAAFLLNRITGEKQYKSALEQHLDWWTTGVNGEQITYTPKGLAWLDSWGSLRYATTTGFIAALYSKCDSCSEKKAKTYWDFAVSQAGYALGDTGFSFEIGFGDKYPQHPHHRTAQGSYCDNMNEPENARHTLYGALVGGPDAEDNYTDEVSNYTTNEVACDYNAGFTGLLAELYSEYKGQTLVDFGAVEEVNEEEFTVEGGINVNGNDFIEIKALICNKSAWPARISQNLEFRYFVDLTEMYKAGESVQDIQITSNYMQAGKNAALVCWNEEKHIYYLSVDFSDDLIYPAGQDNYKKEIQVRIQNAGGPWDNENDPSFVNMENGGINVLEKTALYENGVLIFGEEPGEGIGSGKKISTDRNENKNNNESTDVSENDVKVSENSASENNVGQKTQENDILSVKVDYSGMKRQASGINGMLDIVNKGEKTIVLSDLKIVYYFSNEDKKDMSFTCYHAAVNSENGKYQAVGGCRGTYSSGNMAMADTVCTIDFKDAVKFNTGDKLTVNFCINHSDWSIMNTANDYSVKSAGNICIYSGDELIFGTEP